MENAPRESSHLDSELRALRARQPVTYSWPPSRLRRVSDSIPKITPDRGGMTYPRPVMPPDRGFGTYTPFPRWAAFNQRAKTQARRIRHVAADTIAVATGRAYAVRDEE